MSTVLKLFPESISLKRNMLLGSMTTLSLEDFHYRSGKKISLKS